MAVFFCVITLRFLQRGRTVSGRLRREFHTSSMYEAGKSDQTEGGEAFAGHSAHSRHSPYYAWYIYYDIVVPRLAAAACVALGARRIGTAMLGHHASPFL